MAVAGRRHFEDLPASAGAGRLPAPHAEPAVAVQLVAFLLALLAVAAVCVFDLGPPLASNDDWMYAWSTRLLVRGDGFHVFPLTAPLALPQILWGALLTAGHADYRLLRLTIVPFVVLAAWSVHQLARQLGATPLWAAVAAAAFLSSPLFLAGATTYMSDTPYIALLLAATVAAVAWIQTGKFRILCVALIVAATLQRQAGVAIPLGILVAWALNRGRRTGRRDWALMAIAVVGSGLAVIGPGLLSVSTATLGRMAGFSGGLGLHSVPLIVLPAELGLALMPLAGAFLWFHTRRSSRRLLPGFLGLAPFGVIFVGLSAAGVHAILPGNVFTLDGLQADQALGHRGFFDPTLFTMIEAAALTAFIAIFAIGRHAWETVTANPGKVLVLAVAVGQVVPLLALRAYPYDRYFLVPASLMIPLVAATIGRRPVPVLAQGVALGLIAGGLITYVAAEQDYHAWLAACDQAARIAYRSVSPSEVVAGYVADATYEEVPLYDQTGHLGWLLDGRPPNPRLVLQYAASSDPRPGVNFSSIRPGRIVIVDQLGNGSPPLRPS